MSVRDLKITKLSLHIELVNRSGDDEVMDLSYDLPGFKDVKRQYEVMLEAVKSRAVREMKKWLDRQEE